jgi:hypothetical protein
LAPKALAVSSTTRRTRPSIISRSSGFRQRTVPRIRAVSGMTFDAFESVWNVPTVSTTLCSGSTLRETTVCSVTTICAATSVVSTALCGSAAWPPRPVTTISNSSAEACSGPGRVTISPMGTPGALCMP